MLVERKRTGGFSLIELMVVVAIIGVLAAVAIPSFMKYIAKAKTTEARGQLEKIYSSARAYFLEQQAGRSMSPVPPQFPDAIAVTPAETCCAGNRDRCPADAADWTAPTWRVLHFSMDDPHYYRYSFSSTGTGIEAEFTARANGDLDCDGVQSTFEMYGAMTTLGHDPTGSAGVYREKETE